MEIETRSSKPAIRLFISYSRKDKTGMERLRVALTGMLRDGALSLWCDREIAPGAEWEDAISEALDSADVAVFLVSPDFIHSDYCAGTEMRRALELCATGRLRIIPVRLRKYYWPKAPFSAFQCLPSNGVPISKWRNKDDAWEDVAKGLHRAAGTSQTQRTDSETRRFSQAANQLIDYFRKRRRSAVWTPLLFACSAAMLIGALTYYANRPVERPSTPLWADAIITEVGNHLTQNDAVVKLSLRSQEAIPSHCAAWR